jgi:hypothetical protein
MGYNRGMIEIIVPPAPEIGAIVPAPDPAPVVEELATLRLENAALCAKNAVLQARIRELEARLGQDSSNSSRPPRQIRPSHQRGRKRRPLDGSAVANLDTAGASERCCRSSRSM